MFSVMDENLWSYPLFCGGGQNESFLLRFGAKLHEGGNNFIKMAASLDGKEIIPLPPTFLFKRKQYQLYAMWPTSSL